MNKPHQLRTRMPRLDLQELAEALMQGSPYLPLRNVSCECRAGVLILRGCVPSYYLKQVAQEVVSRLDQVRVVVNQIEVVISPS